jgi:hypothetical protein
MRAAIRRWRQRRLRRLSELQAELVAAGENPSARICEPDIKRLERKLARR